jgi:protein-arginine kinase activator protein McsA
LFEQSGEALILRNLADQIEKQIPPDPMTLLQRQLEEAVQEERYEDAAILRDKIRNLVPPRLGEDETFESDTSI